ncbi:hypothetical protein CANTEDRAFT_126397 [Yamadazyma tenuis ATCC 10573]|uniref:CDC20/Fizzy WD40 domain-containing protein n=1 Tax=Candida tenuis (strain ATCC 10573 / BCRC 21748 / CBS 615 / JCM 9827 / NBRC 10315 / NRRL Y-1498 / VKM Y-70) TaxID=590646 RepID=G3B8T6_CANTC|nr:uncharacterized protein CANTEDRAFT_126397 [Yamadazyma tenuis ATCC 10573]EGV62423.1 hypothetical protein CANTEDRAFT_126397 [Yamadazyma tenuis ATCC 10573]
MSHSPPQNCSRILYTVEVAQASGVTNDFYSNIVSWSKTAKQVAVGVNKTCSIWKLNKNCKTPISFECPDVITCVSCSYEDLVVIGTEAGKIYVISQSDGRLRATYILDNIPIHTCTWFKNNKRFLVGDSSGNVYMIKTIHKQGILILKKDFTFKFHQQLVCGIVLNSDETQVAFGCGDCTVTVWKLEKYRFPVIKFILPHTSAVKAMGFCPWAPSLLATGGGYSDRTIRFWHTNTGTLLNSYFTNSQITSLNWCHSRRELVATFGPGHGGSILEVYKFPSMKPVKRNLLEPLFIRVSGASASPDGRYLCVMCSDSTIRTYKIWGNGSNQMVHNGFDVFESSLISLAEGLNHPSPVIR